ncbi:MAG TPA: sugar ABC transporter permease, partial [Acidimicrobiia bacterium]|nr:sugar ABC transporter permease [Acidimicrobiia bacterium]
MTAAPTKIAPEEEKARTSVRTRLASVGWGLLLLVTLAGGYLFLTDEEQPARLIAGFYRLIGFSSEADAIEEFGLNPLLSKLIIALVALVLGVAGIWALYFIANRLLNTFSGETQSRLRPYVFVGPAVVILAIFLVYPIVGTAIRSVTDGGFAENYGFVFTSDEMLLAWRNNILWLVLGVSGSVIIGLLFAALVDRVRREALAKTFVFLPLAISGVGAAVIWRFVYEWRPPGQPQIGLLNAIITAFGGNPVVFLQTPGLNTIAMIVIMIWLQTGFAMVILSAAIKGVPDEHLEAARIDGATELQVFFRIIIPSIRGSIITVTTTIFIAVLKVFDIVYVLTGGNFESQVLANSMFEQMF